MIAHHGDIVLGLRGKDILIMSPSEWSDNAVSNMQISAILSRYNNVIYIETMGGRMPKLSEIVRVFKRLQAFIWPSSIAKKRKGLDPINVKIVSPLAIPIHGRPLITWFNNKLLSYQIRSAMRAANMTSPIIWSFSPRWEGVIEALEKELFIFHCVDGLHTYDASASFREQFIRTVMSADLIFTPGVLLEKELLQLNPRVHRIGHGCGQEHLQLTTTAVAKPLDIAEIPAPIAVYAGTLANWVDYTLLYQVALQLKEVSFVLIGYVHALAPLAEVESLLALPNVHHLGYKNFSELGAYYRSAAVGLVPYQAANEHIQYSTPTKFLDYFAAGLPVVTTRYPASETMGDLVSLASSVSEFADSIRNAVSFNTNEGQQLRRRYATEHTWDRQVAKMSERILDRQAGDGGESIAATPR